MPDFSVGVNKMVYAPILNGLENQPLCATKENFYRIEVQNFWKDIALIQKFSDPIAKFNELQKSLSGPIDARFELFKSSHKVQIVINFNSQYGVSCCNRDSRATSFRM